MAEVYNYAGQISTLVLFVRVVHIGANAATGTVLPMLADAIS